MEDFCYAGGLPAVMKEIAHLLHTEVVTPTARPWVKTCQRQRTTTQKSSSPLAQPFKDKAGIAVLQRQLGATRRRHQTQRCDTRVDDPHRTRGGV